MQYFLEWGNSAWCISERGTQYVHGILPLLFTIKCQWKLRKRSSHLISLSPLSVSLSHSFPPVPTLLATPRLTFPFFLFLIYFFLLHHLADISPSFEHVMPIVTLVLAILHNFNGFMTVLLTGCYHAVPLSSDFSSSISSQLLHFLQSPV